MLFKKKEEKPWIKFRYREDFEWMERPVPSGKVLPEWLKKVPKIVSENRHEARSIKSCVPVLDACMNGFTLKAWCDLHIIVGDHLDEETGEKRPSVAISSPTTMGMQSTIGQHNWEQVGQDCPLQNYPVGKVLLKLNNPWVIETAPGYSCLFKSPPNHYNNIRLIEGIVDTDTYKRQINFPFFWDGCKQGEFEIKKGDPLVHVVPFKRQDVELQFDSWDHAYMSKMDAIHETVWFDRYKRLWWHKRKEDKHE